MTATKRHVATCLCAAPLALPVLAGHVGARDR